MHYEGNSLPRDTALACDICVVGAGAAGITLARELGRSGVKVVLLESGGFELELDTQKLYDGRASGDIFDRTKTPYLMTSRLRFFGGSTNHWTGLCRPLDTIDFEARPWVARSGWPFGREELDPYAPRAADLLEIPPFDAEAERGTALFSHEEPIETAYFHLSPPTRFGEAYRDELVRSSAVQLVTHANLLSLVTDRDGRRVVAARAATLGGRRFEVAAKLFVLACGGIENARLLLLSDEVQKSGLGNEHDLVGRYFMEHPHVAAGWAALPGRASAIRRYVRCREHVCLGLRVSDEMQRRDRLLNSSYRFDFPLERVGLRPDLLGEVEELAEAVQAAGASPSPRRSKVQTVRMVVICEQVPNPESRVTLSPERDALGARRARLAWRLGEAELASLRDSCRRMAHAFGSHGLGRIGHLDQADELWSGSVGGNHHIGTTRMHDDPKQGVVDRNARVHGIANLFVAGSSVFPTCGCSNPTFTILQLTLRLADYLRGVLTAAA